MGSDDPNGQQSDGTAGAGDPAGDGYRVAVAAANPETVEQLTRTAADLAREEGGSVLVVSVVVKPRESPFALFRDEVIKREFGGNRQAVLDRAVEVAAGAGVDVDGRLVVATSVVRGVLAALEEADCDAVVVGWRERSRADAVLGTDVDRIVRRAACDVLVEKLGPTADGVDSILLAAAESPHTGLAARVARAIARANDARVVALHVLEPGRTGADARELLGVVEATLDPVAVEARIEEASDVTDAIVAATDAHDVTVLGATREGLLRRRIVGTTPRAVGRRARSTVVIARRRGEGWYPLLPVGW